MRGAFQGPGRWHRACSPGVSGFRWRPQLVMLRDSPRGRGLTHLRNSDMRKHLLGLMLVAAITGCSSDPDVAQSGKAVEATGVEGASQPTASSLAALRQSASSFASLPDRGELLAYGGARKVR